MKHFYLLLLFAWTFGTGFAQVTFVDASASGSADGSSWANAYPDLNTALADPMADTIWVAGGTYTPGSDSSDTYVVNRPVALFGGFAGTEGNLSERVLGATPTILSGDHNGDDVPGNFTMNRDDNARTVMLIDSLIQGIVTLDGFTITSGFKSDSADDAPTDQFSGAGIFSYSRVNISNCTFTEHRAEGGAALTLFDRGVDTSSVVNSVFEDNLSTEFGTFLVIGVLDLVIDSCEMRNNTTSFGTLLLAGAAIIDVRNSIIEDNSSIQPAPDAGGGGAIYAVQSIGILIDETIIRNNIAFQGSGGGVFAILEDPFPNPNVFIIRNSSFEGNTADAFGGGAILLNTSFGAIGSQFVNNTSLSGFGGGLYTEGDSTISVIDSCSFSSNTALSAGGLLLRDEASLASVNNSEFVNNLAMGPVNMTSDGFGGGLIAVGSAQVDIDSCLFSTNEGRAGAAIYTGSRSVTRVTNSRFEDNLGQVEGFAGAIGAAGDLEVSIDETTFIEVDNCEFVNNESEDAGAIYLLRNVDARVRNSSFDRNISTLGPGGAIRSDSSRLDIDNCTFTENSTEFTGGAIFSGFTGSAVIQNSIFTGNTSENAGGAIMVQDDSTTLTVINSEFNGNVSRSESGAGSGGAIFTLGLIETTIDGSLFEGNQSGVGGAIGMSLFESEPSSEITTTIDQSIFFLNLSFNQAGAVNVENINSEIINCAFANNLIQPDGGTGGNGGAISLNAAESVTMETYIINSTLLNNSGGIAPGIANFDDSNEGNSTARSTLFLQNTFAVHAAGDSYVIEDGNPQLVSLGGNFFGDGSLGAAATATDIEDPTAIGTAIIPNVALLDFTPVETSPLVDAGVTGELVPMVDLIGNARDSMPDIGAVEVGATNNVREDVVQNDGQLFVLPNPIAETGAVQLINDWSGRLLFRLFDVQGRELQRWTAEKVTREQLFPLQLSNLPSGTYSLLVSTGQQAVIEQLIKR